MIRAHGRGGVMATVLLAALLLAGPAQAHPPRAKPCAARGSTTVARSVQARVYVRDMRESDDHALVGCLLGNGRRVTLETWFSCDCSRGDENDPQVWLRGTVVAVNRYSCPPDPFLGPCVGRARTVALRSGRTVRELQTGGRVGELVIGERGAFALLLGGAVMKVDAEGEAVLDPGPGVEEGSLALAGPRLYWMRDDAPRSARLRF